MVRPIFEQYKQEIPINHLDMPTEELPETGVEINFLFILLTFIFTFALCAKECVSFCLSFDV